MPFVVAGHRGARNLIPENTLPSLAHAVELGVNELEIDLRPSRDGRIMIIHDATVDRTTDGSGAVRELTFEQLRALDAGNGEQIPTLAEVLDATEVSLQVEIKDPAVIDPVLELLDERPGEISRLAPTSFDAESVHRLARAWPDVCVGLINAVARPGLLDEAIEVGAGRVLVGLESTDTAFVRAAHRYGLQVNVWQVNTVADVHQAVDLGVDGFTTDDPRVVAQAGYTLTDQGLVRT